jgi:hypothetical protein
MDGDPLFLRGKCNRLIAEVRARRSQIDVRCGLRGALSAMEIAPVSVPFV